jgi:hypothetical protein
MLRVSRLAGNRNLVRVWRAVAQHNWQRFHSLGKSSMQAAQPQAMHRSSSSSMPCLHQQTCRLPAPSARHHYHHHQQQLFSRRLHAYPAPTASSSRPCRHYPPASATRVSSYSSSSSSSIWRASKPVGRGPILLSSSCSSSGAVHRQQHLSSTAAAAAAAATDTAPSSTAATPAAAVMAAATQEELSALRSKLQLFNTMSRQKEVSAGDHGALLSHIQVCLCTDEDVGTDMKRVQPTRTLIDGGYCCATCCCMHSIDCWPFT